MLRCCLVCQLLVIGAIGVEDLSTRAMDRVIKRSSTAVPRPVRPQMLPPLQRHLKPGTLPCNWEAGPRAFFPGRDRPVLPVSRASCKK